MEDFCIGLCVYNNEQGLPAVIRNLLHIKNHFVKTKIIFFYDPSQDNSLFLLMDLKKRFPAEVDIIINKQTKTNMRTENIANARNGILQVIREKYSQVKYFVMMDSNEYSCIGDIQIDVLKGVFSNSEKWDSISFDREAGYYDYWALSFNPYVYSFFHFNNWRVVVEKMRSEFTQLLNDYKQNKPDEMIPVLSAFNGFAIYKTSHFLDCCYSSNIHLEYFPPHSIEKQVQMNGDNIVSNLNNDCEHRHFHLESIYKHNSKIRVCTQSLFKKLENPPEGLRGPA